MDRTFDCDIRRIFNAFYSKYGPEYENNKLFSYHLNCYPQCPTGTTIEGICRHSSEVPFVFGTVSDPNSINNCLIVHGIIKHDHFLMEFNIRMD